MDSGLQSLMVILGPILLAAALAWVIFNNRRSKAAEDRTEEATRRQYDAQNARDQSEVR